MLQISLLLLLPLLSSSLSPPFNKGVVVKVGEGLIGDIAFEIADAAVEELKDVVLSDSIRDGGTTYNYWNLLFTKLSLNRPVIDLSSGHTKDDSLTVDARISGSLRVTGRWRVKQNTWFGEISTSGGIVLVMNSFSVNSRVYLGEKSDGMMGFTHDPDYCLMDVGRFDVDFSGRTGWLLNMIVSLFKTTLEETLEDKICEKIKEAAAEGASALENSTLQRYNDFIDVLGHRIVFNNRPWTITGGEDCAVIGILGEISTEGEQPQPGPTTPFLVPTTEPIVVEEEEEKEENTDAFSTSSYPTTVPKELERRAAKDICQELPGGNSAVSVLITEEMIGRVADNLYQLNLIDYKAVQERGTSDTFQQYWGGRDMGVITCPTTHDLLRDYNMKVRVTSTAPPEISIGTEGVSVISDLRTRITLIGDAFTGKLEFHTSGYFVIEVLLEFKNGVYRVVPSVELNVDVEDVKLQLGNSLGGRMTSSILGENILDEIEEKLNEMLVNKLPELLKEELQAGFPVNIPDCILIDEAEIVYREEYILITARDVVVTL